MTKENLLIYIAMK